MYRAVLSVLFSDKLSLKAFKNVKGKEEEEGRIAKSQ